jgi:hypothetical protein
MIGALNVILLTMRQQDTVTQTIIEKANSDLNKLNEKIEITDVRLTSNNRFNITVANTGGSAAQLASIYIINETAATKQQFRFDLNNVVDGRSSVKNIGTNLAFTVKDLTQYSVRIVTKLGNSVSLTVGSLSNTPLQLTMFVIPPTLAPGGGNVTIMMSVTNNYTDVAFPRTINVSMSHSGACTATARYLCTVNLMLADGNNTLIQRGSTAFYKWIYNINSPDGTVYTFTGKIVNGVPSNTVTARVTLKLLDSNNSANTDIVSLKFLNTVGIGLIAPGPFGVSNNQAFFGMVVSNPTSLPLNVTKVALSVISPAGASADVIFKGTNSASGCGTGTTLTAVSPITGTWKCPANNQIQWKASTPITVNGYQSYMFLVSISTNSINSDEVPAGLITATAFTTYGQFSKSGYTTNLVKTGAAMVSLYGATRYDNQTSSNYVLGNINSWQSDTTKILNFTLTNFDSSKQINAGAHIVINLPPQWSFDTSWLKYGGFGTPVINTISSDGSAQLIAARTSAITGSGSTVAGTISVKVKAPIVTEKRIYIISVTSDGDTTGSYPVGAIAEFPVEVCKVC